MAGGKRAREARRVRENGGRRDKVENRMGREINRKIKKGNIDISSFKQF